MLKARWLAVIALVLVVVGLALAVVPHVEALQARGYTERFLEAVETGDRAEIDRAIRRRDMSSTEQERAETQIARLRAAMDSQYWRVSAIIDEPPSNFAILYFDEDGSGSGYFLVLELYRQADGSWGVVMDSDSFSAGF